jgi:hypothetical protein
MKLLFERGQEKMFSILQKKLSSLKNVISMIAA